MKLAPATRTRTLALTVLVACWLPACADDPAPADPDVVDAADGAVPDADASDASDDASLDVPDVGDDAQPSGVDPGAPGPFGTERSEWSIPTSIQDVRTVAFRPVGDDGAPYPVVILHHGFTLRAENFEGYGERLASHGFLALLPSMDDGLMSPLTHAQLRDIQIELVDWLEDAAASPGSAAFGLADTARIGVAGHSRGGKQAMFGAVSDSRVAAVFGIDPVDAAPPFGGDPADFPSVTPELMDGLQVPSGYIGAGLGPESAAGVPACAPEGEGYAAYFEASPSPTFAWLLPDAGHNDFVEACEVFCRAACPGSDDPDAAASFARATIVAFFEVFLVGDARYRPWLDGAQVPEGVVATAR